MSPFWRANKTEKEVSRVCGGQRLGRDYGHTKGYGENVASKIDSEVKRIVDECYDKAKAIILDHRDVLDAAAALLLEKEKISRDEFEALFEKEEAVPAV